MTPFDVYRLPNGNILCDTGDTGLIEHDAFGVPGRGHVDLTEGAVKLIPESEGLEPLLATNRRLHAQLAEALSDWRKEADGRDKQVDALRGELAEAKAAQVQHVTWLNGKCEDCDYFGNLTLSQRMRAAADVLEEAATRSGRMDLSTAWPKGRPEIVPFSAMGLRNYAGDWEVEDRERAETEQLVEDVAELIFGAEWEGRPGHQWTEARARLNDFNAKFTIARKATS